MITTLLLSITGTILTLQLTPRPHLWYTSISQTSFLLLFSVLIISENINNNWTNLNNTLACDQLSSPLLILSFWLIPVSIIANISPLYNAPTNSQRNFLTFILIILFSLIITFSATNLILFFIGFESTLIPTLLLITRWGAQNERIEAGYYFVFYTLLSSLPLLLALLFIYSETNSLNILLGPPTNLSGPCSIACILAFLVKVPIFGFHLWLPKAHVEAPIAGSMILAAILLKMGGYGFIRLYNFLASSLYPSFSTLLVSFCCWGGLLTSLICLTQTDLKSLIAYSSVSHMSFMIASLATGTQWGLSAGILIMIAHGITSPALFSLANLLYERTNTRTLILNRGFKQFHNLLPLLWLFFLASNLGLPPFPNSMGELLCFSAILGHSNLLLPLVGAAIILTSIFSLSIYLLTSSGWGFQWHTTSSSLQEREILLLILHALPLLLLICAPSFII